MHRCFPSVSAVAVAAVLALAGSLLLHAGAGFDFTDESFYLLWMEGPRAFPASVSQFGFLYHPLYRLLDGDIALLRQCNLLGTFLLGWAVAGALLYSLRGADGARELWRRGEGIAVAFVAASGVLVYFSTWLPTPSYNSLALQALLVAAAGMLLCEAESSCPSLAGWALVGIGEFLAIMAKPTAGLALAAVLGIYWLAAGVWRWRLLGLAVAICVALLLASALLIDGSPGAFAVRLAQGADGLRLLTATPLQQTLLHLDKLPVTPSGLRALMVAAALIFTVMCLCLSARVTWRIVGTLVLAAACLFCLGLAVGLPIPAFGVQARDSMLSLAVPLGAMPAIVLMLWRQHRLRQVTRRSVAIAVAFFLFPCAYAFGSGNNGWIQAELAGFFWMLPSIALLVPATASQRQWLLPCLCVGVAALTVTCVLLAAALAAPYRQAPLTEDRTPLRMANADATLNVAPGVAGYVDRLRQSAAQDGFRPGDPLIDLSGHTPGVAYVLGARPPGVAWLFGGYPGSEAYAALALDRVDCDTLSRAWILLEPAGTARLPVELLERYGMDAQRDYRRSPPLHAPSDYEKFGARDQYLLSPLRPASTRSACEERRAEKP